MKFIIDETDEYKRLDGFLSEVLKDVSRSKIQRLIKDEKVLVNGVLKKTSYLLKESDLITAEIPDDVEKIQILPENIDLNIVYEDENMLVVNKPSGILTHPTTTEKTGTLVNALINRYGKNLSDINGEFRRGILHRLDRNTSGLLMIAKNNSAHEFLSNQIKNRSVEKKYLAIVRGNIEQNEFVINKPIARNPHKPEKMAVIENGKPSITKVKVLERFSDATYVELTLVTGRTHQIRVHLASISHPVFNDTLYGFGKMKVKTDGQVLQSYKLKFAKPMSGEIIELELKPDEKIIKVLKYLKGVKL